MAQEHFRTPPDPKKGYKNEKKAPNITPEILSIYGMGKNLALDSGMGQIRAGHFDCWNRVLGKGPLV